ncbi:glycosyltransferase [Deinococcus pimensis]|uniref:glycosyltransferase n=1 Tax=Deinococcus pimensis TaxID=309888 RepID=UPI0005EB8DDC|nr:glycosyltransferase [Deinococcus pimensis]
MARVLIATAPYVGHVNPATSIARTLTSRGHEVVWYTSRAFERAVEVTGATFTPMRPHLEFDPTNLDERFPARARLNPLKKWEHDIKHLLADFIPDTLDDVREVLRVFPADVILTDVAFVAGRSVHHHTGLPWVSFNPAPVTCSSRDTAPFGFGLRPDASPLGRARNAALNWLVQRALLGGADRYLAGREREVGTPPSGRFVLDAMIHAPDVLLQGTIPELEYPRSDLPATVHFIGALLPDPATDYVRPAWWGELTSGRKVVHVTQGTIDNTDFSKLILPTLRALAGEDVFVIATTGGRDVSEVRAALPVNARVEAFIPHDLLLPFVDVMVTNAGFGGVQRALAAGVPLVLAGKEADKAEVCGRVAYAGAGIDLRTETPTPRQLQESVRAVLTLPSYRERAATMRAAFARHDAATRAADLIEAAARKGERPVSTREAVALA